MPTVQHGGAAAQAARTASAAIVKVGANINYDLVESALPNFLPEKARIVGAILVAAGVAPESLDHKVNMPAIFKAGTYIADYGMIPGEHFFAITYNVAVKGKSGAPETTVPTISIQRSYAYLQGCVEKAALAFGRLAFVDRVVVFGDEAIQVAGMYGQPDDFVREGESAGKLHPSVVVAKARIRLLSKDGTETATEWSYYVLPSAQGTRSDQRVKKMANTQVAADYALKRAASKACKTFTQAMYPVDARATHEDQRLLVAAQAALVMADKTVEERREVAKLNATEDVEGDFVSLSPPAPAPVSDDASLFDDESESVSVAELAAELWSEQPIARLAFEARKAGEGKQDGKDFGKSLEAVKAGIASNLGLETGNDLVETLIEYVGIDSLATLKAFALSIFERSQNGGINPKSPTEGFGAVKTAIQTLSDRLNA